MTKRNSEQFMPFNFSSALISRKIFNAFGRVLKPVLIALRITPVQAAMLSLVICIFAAMETVKGNWTIGFILYVLSSILNQGVIKAAKEIGSSTFFDHFVNGLIKVVNVVVIRFALCWLIFNQFGLSSLFWISAFCLVITPYALFIFDRYAAFSRWIKEETEILINPEVPATHLIQIAHEAGRMILVVSLFYFSLGMWLYFAVNSVLGLSFIVYHIYSAHKKMRIDNLQSSLKRYKREDGKK